jgi:hypothetical protein
MNVVFYDIDGVLSISRRLGLDRVAVGYLERLKEVDDNTHLVSCSTWRIRYSKDELLAKFRAVGFTKDFPEDWRTPSILYGVRGDEIDAYRANHPEIEKYIILDDENEYHAHHPLIKPKGGLLSEEDWLLANQLLYGDENVWFEFKKDQNSKKSPVVTTLADSIGARSIAPPLNSLQG